MIESAIIVLLFLGVYPYVIYPMLLWLVAHLVPGNTASGETELSVTVVIAAFNEEASIESTVLNKLEQNYPPSLDPSKVELSDLRDSYNDPLLAACRKQLRKNIPGMHLRHKKKFGIPCVFSAEPVRYPHPDGHSRTPGVTQRAPRDLKRHRAPP